MGPIAMVYECSHALSIYQFLKINNMSAHVGDRGESPIEVWQPHNKKELADLMGVSPYVLNKMLDTVKNELGEPAGTIYSVKQVQFLVGRFGLRGKES